MNAIEIRNLSKSFRSMYAVDHLNMTALISVAAKQKAWLSICGSLGGGMLLFMMIDLVAAPLKSTVINVLLCLVGGILFAWGLGAIVKAILKKTSLV